MKNLVLTMTTVFFASVIFTSCKKEKEEIPVQEEQATTLNQGNGIMETVQKAPNGAAVVFSNWIQKIDTDWTGFGVTKWTTDMNTTSLTSAVRDNGLVLVYFNLNGFISQLPNESLGENLVLDYYFTTGKITARYTYGGGSVVGNPWYIKFRYILIPSSAFDIPGPGGRTHQPVDYSNYNAVCEYYGIEK